jgi:hypothetical protein
MLPEDVWGSRHQTILVLLWVHAALIPFYALFRGCSPLHSLLEAAILPITAIITSFRRHVTAPRPSPAQAAAVSWTT